MMNRRRFGQWLNASALSGLALMLSLGGQMAYAAEEAPDVMIGRVSTEVLETIKADKSMAADVNKVMALVDAKIMPTVNFTRMTASAVGPAWRQASAEQKSKLQEEFKTLLVRTYAGALGLVGDQTIFVKPVRMAADDKEVVVRTEIRGRGDPIQLDYRLEKAADASWRVYNLNVTGIWLVETYRSQFAPEINSNGLDGLITELVKRNKANAAKKA